MGKSPLYQIIFLGQLSFSILKNSLTNHVSLQQNKPASGTRNLQYIQTISLLSLFPNQLTSMFNCNFRLLISLHQCLIVIFVS